MARMGTSEVTCKSPWMSQRWSYMYKAILISFQPATKPILRILPSPSQQITEIELQRSPRSLRELALTDPGWLSHSGDYPPPDPVDNLKAGPLQEPDMPRSSGMVVNATRGSMQRARFDSSSSTASAVHHHCPRRTKVVGWNMQTNPTI